MQRWSMAMRLNRCDLSANEPLLGCDLGGALGGAISVVLGCDETGAFGAMGSLLFLSLSSIFLGWKSFEGKIKPELVLRVKRVILRSTRKLISV